MKKILRKVYTKDRLPEDNNEYYVDGDYLGKGVLKFDNDIKDLSFLHSIGVDYWYEEVEIDLIAIERLGLKDKFIHSELFAKERYEKSYNFIKDHKVGAYTYSKDYVLEALKIAAGINKEEI